MSDEPVGLQIWQRAEISPRDLAVLRRQVRLMKEALVSIQQMAEEEIRLNLVTSKSSIWQIEADARAAIEEVKG